MRATINQVQAFGHAARHELDSDATRMQIDWHLHQQIARFVRRTTRCLLVGFSGAVAPDSDPLASAQ
jgi:hypothetical protein